MIFKTVLAIAVFILLFHASSFSADPAPVLPAPAPSPTLSPLPEPIVVEPTVLDAHDFAPIAIETPGEISRALKTKTEALAKLKFTERLAVLTELKVWLEAEEKAGKDEAISFIVALEPVFERAQDLQDMKVCQEVRLRMLFAFESGTGYDGKLPYFVPESLQVLSQLCDDKKLANPK